MKAIDLMNELVDFVELLKKLGDMDLDTDVSLWVRARDSQELKIMARRIGGPFEKSQTDRSFFLDRQFSKHIRIHIAIWRAAICTRVVSEKRVAAKPEIVLPAVPEHLEEVVTWECPDSILALANTQESGQ